MQYFLHTLLYKFKLHSFGLLHNICCCGNKWFTASWCIHNWYWGNKFRMEIANRASRPLRERFDYIYMKGITAWYGGTVITNTTTYYRQWNTGVGTWPVMARYTYLVIGNRVVHTAVNISCLFHCQMGYFISMIGRSWVGG